MLLASLKLGCHLRFLTFPPSPHLSSPTKSWQFCVQNMHPGTSLVVQWLGLYTATAGATGLIPGLGTKIPLQVAFCFTFHCYFVRFIHVNLVFIHFHFYTAFFYLNMWQKKKKCIQQDRFTLLLPPAPGSRHSTLPQGPWNGFQMASNWLNELFKTQVEPSLKFFILMLLFFIPPLLGLMAPSQLVITCFFLPLFSCLSSPLTCQFHEGIRPASCTRAAQQLVHLNTRGWMNTPCQIWTKSLLSLSGVHPASSGYFTWWGSH